MLFSSSKLLTEPGGQSGPLMRKTKGHFGAASALYFFLSHSNTAHVAAKSSSLYFRISAIRLSRLASSSPNCRRIRPLSARSRRTLPRPLGCS